MSYALHRGMLSEHFDTVWYQLILGSLELVGHSNLATANSSSGLEACTIAKQSAKSVLSLDSPLPKKYRRHFHHASFMGADSFEVYTQPVKAAAAGGV